MGESGSKQTPAESLLSQNGVSRTAGSFFESTGGSVLASAEELGGASSRNRRSRAETPPRPARFPLGDSVSAGPITLGFIRAARSLHRPPHGRGTTEQCGVGMKRNFRPQIQPARTCGDLSMEVCSNLPMGLPQFGWVARSMRPSGSQTGGCVLLIRSRSSRSL